MKVPQTAPVFDAETRSAVDAVLASGWITEGPQCEAFTAELLEYMQAPYGCLVSNGTVALMLGIAAFRLARSRLVRVPDLTFAATANACIAFGSRPLLTDAKLRAGTPHTCMPVWLFGNRPSWFTDGGRFVEDAAQAIGCWHDGKHAGTFGDVGCFSFYADKTITTGEGGFVVTRDKAIYERLEQLRNHGRGRGARGYAHEGWGINARMTDMQAAIGRCQLRHLPEYIAARNGHWAHYNCELSSIPGVLVLPRDEGSVPFRCVIKVPDPVALAAHLEEREIQTRRMFLPLHRQPFLSRYVRPGQTFPHADDAYAYGLLLPVHQGLSEGQVSFVCDSIREFYRG